MKTPKDECLNLQTNIGFLFSEGEIETETEAEE